MIIYKCLKIVYLKCSSWKIFSSMLCFMILKAEMHPIFCFIEFQELALMYESRK